MGWSTSVIAPPDGDMAAYMRSLDKLLRRDDAVYWPTHGAEIRDPSPYVAAFIAHRHERSDAILARARRRRRRPSRRSCARVYAGLDPRLVAAAGRSVLAHLIELVEEGRVAADGPPRLGARYRLKL